MNIKTSNWLFGIMMIMIVIISFLSASCEKDNLKVSAPYAITDIDGNVYHSVIIGNQEWMVENLAVTHLNDGTEIKLLSSDNEWVSSTYPSYCWYDNTVNTDNKHGLLYNFYTVNTGKLAPNGWHIPSDEEWKELEMFIGMSEQDADQRFWRGAGLSVLLASRDWFDLPYGECDQYGFSGLPAGGRNGYSGGFADGAIWWSTTECDIFIDPNEPWLCGAWIREITNNDKEFRIGRNVGIFQTGLSVRCIKNK
jgi:uncharacterized protein (TIGR02145 family)